MAQIMIEKLKSYKLDFTKTEQDNRDIWDEHLRERKHMLAEIAKHRRKNRIRECIELILMLIFIYYMFQDMYKDGDLDPIIKFLKYSIV